jgi:hypothetical protein
MQAGRPHGAENDAIAPVGDAQRIAAWHGACKSSLLLHDQSTYRAAP